MIGIGFSANTPVDIVTLWWIVDRFVTLVAIAETFTATRLAATIVVRNDVSLAIGWVLTGADPGDR